MEPGEGEPGDLRLEDLWNSPLEPYCCGTLRLDQLLPLLALRIVGGLLH